jgi:hypothetical protein
MRVLCETEVFKSRWQPYSGFHDDHRGKDRTPEYKPAVQQCREEFYALVEVLKQHGLGKNMLQLGLGTTTASHELWRKVFSEVTTIDSWLCMNDGTNYTGMNTHSMEAIKFAERFAPYDFLFIDAGHKYKDVEQDFYCYTNMVRQGGIIAFHDALKRPTYEEEIEVWKFLDTLRQSMAVNMIGTEIGTAWMIRP